MWLFLVEGVSLGGRGEGEGGGGGGRGERRRGGRGGVRGEGGGGVMELLPARLECSVRYIYGLSIVSDALGS